MKAQERCSCGATFNAEGRGALAAMKDWRATHQHSFAPSPIGIQPFQPISPPWTPQPFRSQFPTVTGTLERPFAGTACT